MQIRSILGMAMGCFLFFVVVSSVQAQVTTTTILGRVTDSTGAPVAGAQVTARNLDTNLTRGVQTNSDGEYRIEFLPVGTYSVEVVASGFKKAVDNSLALNMNVDARADFTLQIGGMNETISVEAPVPLVNTSNSEIGRTVENLEIINLPIVNRNVYTLLNLVPGVQSSANSIVLGYPEQRTMINGGIDAGAGSVSYYLDGGTNMTGLRNTGNILPNPDAIQEFRVETNNYNAEYGRFSGGVVTVLTKSGTNQFHGSLFEFYRDTVFNANTWGNLGPTPPIHRNQFGATVGGPIQKDKTFFFFSYSGLRQLTSTFLSGGIVPTGLERQGNFSQSVVGGKPVNVIVPKGSSYPGQTPGQPFTCNGVKNVICPSFMDPVATKIIDTYIPMPNVGTNGWQGILPSPYNTDEYLIKIDRVISPNQRLTGSYFETSGSNVIQAGTGNLPWSMQQFNWRQHNVNISDTWTINSSTVNQAWLSYTRNFGGRLNLPQTSLGDLGSAFTAQGTPSLPQITVTNYFTLSQAIAGPSAGTNMYDARDVVSHTRGRHAITFGGELSLDKDIQQTLLNNYGVFSFNAQGESTNALSNFELGLPTTVSQDAPVTGYTNSWNTGVFVQDDFRIHPRLTLNLGLRWDIQTPPTDPLNREATFVQGVQSTVLPTAPLGMLFVGDPGVTRGTIPVRWHHVSPRLGVAWDPFGDGKTSIRAGAGVFYGSVSGNEWNTTTNFEPFAIRYTLPNVGTPTGATLGNPYHGLAGGDPFPYTYDPKNPRFLAGGSIFNFAKNFQWPYTYQLNLAIQRQVTSDLSVQVAYVGALSHDLPFAIDLNYPVVTPTATAASSNILSRRPIDTGVLGQIQQVNSTQTGSYNGLQISAVKRWKRNFLINAFYTYSKTFDSVQLDNSTAQGGVESFADIALDRGRADFDMRHMFVASGTWLLDYYRGQSGVARFILNGWSISPIVTLHSGTPFTILNGKDANLDGNSTDRANLVAGINPVLDPRRSRWAAAAEWFNTAAFSQNQVVTGVATNGNSSRNFLDGPGARDVDLAVFRDFRFRERFTLQARLEALNAFNLVNLDIPRGNETTVGSSTFGQILTNNPANPMRQLQLGVRLTF